KLGSLLNGGGAWPGGNKHATADDWIKEADKYYLAVKAAFEERGYNIPFMWATDAVHGHNNAFSATVFPHNIGLGATRDPELIKRIGEVTAKEIVATGLDWTFAPTVATPRDLRWGRVYEGYSEDPEITYVYAAEMVQGLQGDSESLKSDLKVISNVKHWVGDGGTQSGIDRGVNGYSEDNLRNIHAMGYFSGLEAGAQVVMSSFNSWDNAANYDLSPEIGEIYNHKIHGSRYLLTDVLKDKMGFDGIVVTDWHGHSEVSNCDDGDASYSINAGNDVLMIPVRKHWQKAYQKTVEDVQAGVIPMSRIDDAVTRILRVKKRAGLWDKAMPSARSLAGKQDLLGAPEHREIARDAVRKSLTLLKNNDNILPLSSLTKVLLTGSAADDLQKQSGGWNLTWQGDENTLADFPGATTTRMALESVLGKDNVIFDPELSSELSAGDTAIVVFGEDPYAEMMGDIKAWQTLEFASLKRSYKKDIEKIHRLHAAGVKVISLFFSGRPLYVNEEINKSEAFIAAWLPGSEGMGIVDVMVGDQQGKVNYDFQGRLSYSWPMKKSSVTVNRIPTHIEDYVLPENELDPLGEHAPLFPYGYGLNYSDPTRALGVDLNAIPLDTDDQDTTGAAHDIELYGIKSTIGDFQLKVADALSWNGSEVSRNGPVEMQGLDTKPYNYQQQQDAVEVTFKGQFGAVYVQTGDGESEDFNGYANGCINFQLLITQQPTQPVMFALHKWTECEDLSDVVALDITAQLTGAKDADAKQGWIDVSIPLQSLTNLGVDLSELDTPFMLFTKGHFKTVIANITCAA
ncbi:MAG: glycoside hydrolase family 3 N-terminal domain-containing protein, partial [Psychromonas sp.]